jgi:hypothetical protein
MRVVTGEVVAGHEVSHEVRLDGNLHGLRAVRLELTNADIDVLRGLLYEDREKLSNILHALDIITG